jgi:hypothetical protein
VRKVASSGPKMGCRSRSRAFLGAASRKAQSTGYPHCIRPSTAAQRDLRPGLGAALCPVERRVCDRRSDPSCNAPPVLRRSNRSSVTQFMPGRKTAIFLRWMVSRTAGRTVETWQPSVRGKRPSERDPHRAPAAYQSPVFGSHSSGSNSHPSVPISHPAVSISHPSVPDSHP